MNKRALQQAAMEARGLAIDAVATCASGHLGLPLGCAEMGAILWGEELNYDPSTPRWINRDRFILSAGHGSMFLYSWLHLAGYDLPLQELKDFRKLGSMTPGHPEYRHTPGVEATTGPLGQGIANAVGFAISGKRAAAVFNTAEHTIFDYKVFALAGDGCLQEGVAREAVSLAGHLKLDNLILIYDSNDVTLDASAEVTQSDDYPLWFAAQGWESVTIDGHDFDAIRGALKWARASKNGKPKVIIAKTVIGRGIPEVAGTAKAHGEGGAKFADSAKQALGIPEGERFFVSTPTRDFFTKRQAQLAGLHQTWEVTYTEWQRANPELAKRLAQGFAGDLPAKLNDLVPTGDSLSLGEMATREYSGIVLESIAKILPDFLTGSADLFGSTKNYLKGQGDYSSDNPTGRNLWFGIREHAMAAILNGIAYDGLFRCSGATFLVFADYLRPSVRIAALAGLPVTYILTHDSVAVGEDGPTHQPVETVSGLRVIPNLDVIRPADYEETAAAYIAALERKTGPTAIILSRQKLPKIHTASIAERRRGVLEGAYVVRKETSALDLVILASGSEVGVALQAADELGNGVRVISVPCMSRFDRLSRERKDDILPPGFSRKIAIEAGVPDLWWKYVGTNGKVIGIDRFGLSAPGNTVLAELGISVRSIVKAAREF